MATKCVPRAHPGTVGLKGSLVPVSATSTHQSLAYHRTWEGSSERRLHTSRIGEASKSDEKRRAEDRQDIVVSVLQASATRRDAKTYLQKYAPPTWAGQRQGPRELDKPFLSSWSSSTSVRAVSETPQFVQGNRTEAAVEPDSVPNLAIVKLRVPQALDDQELWGLARSLSQLRKLGLISVVVLDAGLEKSRDVYTQQAQRLQQALDESGRPGARIADQVFLDKTARDSGYLPSSVAVHPLHVFARGIEAEEIIIVSPIALNSTLDSVRLIDADDAMIALTKYFCGLQSTEWQSQDFSLQTTTTTARIASIERVIILDPLGAIPIPGPSGASHRFINLEQEFKQIIHSLTAEPVDDGRFVHIQNLKLLRDILSFLPPTSTALISPPSVTAAKGSGSLTLVATRDKVDPLIHNLLTDKPVFSSSLPLERVRSDRNAQDASGGHIATVVKRGMPVTIYPDPMKTPWVPPSPGAPRLRLTDKCIDLPRLRHLIEDSFDRKLDLEHYLKRLNDNLAGIIIAGEYEGGAVLTWERPSCLSNEEAYSSGRLVPYLDKFAVLKCRQGSGGVADVVFNAMVRSCFPNGVSWRSRKDNPVNKWYFERSLGTRKLQDTNWTMFWTTPNLAFTDTKLGDYEDVCRGVEPSWADKQQAAD